MNPPKVTTIIPVHNGEQYLADCIRSVLCQTWRNQEIIVVDDGSTDNSRKVAEAFADRGVEILQTEPERPGAAAARNVGLDHGTGDFIQYLDSDDLLPPNKIAAQLAELERLPSGFLASCRWTKFRRSAEDARSEEHAIFADFGPVDWLVTSWEGGGMMQTACWLTPRRIADKAGPWDESLRRNPDDDGEYFSRVLLRSRGVRFCADTAVYYRVPGEDSVSKQVGRESVNSLFMTCERYREGILRAEDSPRVRHALAVKYANFIYRFHPDYPELRRRAVRRIRELGFRRIPLVGGRAFRRVAAIAGFRGALILRSMMGRGRSAK